IEGGIRRPEPTHVEDCRQPALLHEDVAGHEVAVTQGVVGLSRQLPEPRPGLPQPEDIEEAFTALEAELDPLRVSVEGPAAALSGEPPAADVDGPQLPDEPRKIVGECIGPRGVALVRGRAGQPRLDGPRQWLAEAGIASRHALRTRDGRDGGYGP